MLTLDRCELDVYVWNGMRLRCIYDDVHFKYEAFPSRSNLMSESIFLVTRVTESKENFPRAAVH
jgi:hypothetical protein